jgi:hypothetical protein
MFVGAGRALTVLLLAAALATAAAPIDFNREIRPLLSDKCFACHGNDNAARKSKLRLDSEAAAKADLGGHFAIVPGEPQKSELVRRITAANSGVRMPPVWSGRALSAGDIELLTRWVAEGARWQRHWAFLPPERPESPAVKLASWPRNPIDNFVLARLEREGLEPSPEADRVTLIRRASLDLTGLPPTPSEVDAFVNDRSPAPWENVIDRLLASPRYGERMAARWLDAARYADTNGYQTDAERYMWRWRDWVIDAFNSNKPFDRFTVEQIAGDRLPNATLDQKIATGFNRNHRGNSEGGIVPEEYLVEYAVDRVDTMATVFLGVTLGCARCHSHKYDPFTQREFYQLLAYFNNIPEYGRYLKFGNTPPMIKAPTRDEQAKLASLEHALSAATERLRLLEPSIGSAQGAWEKTLAAAADWTISEDLDVHAALDEPGTPGIIGGAARFDGKRVLDAGDHGYFGFFDRFSAAVWVHPDSDTGAILSRGEDDSHGEGWGVFLEHGKVQLNLIKRRLDDSLRVETKNSVAPGQWHHIAVTYDGSRISTGVHIYIDGVEQNLNVLLDGLNQDFKTKTSLRIGAGAGLRFNGLIDEARIYRRVLTGEEAAILAVPRSLGELARVKPQKRTAAESAKLRRAFLQDGGNHALTAAWTAERQARAARDTFVDSVPTVMVMEESGSPKETFLLVRGAYDRPGEKVMRGVPEVLPPLPPGVPNDRLGLAQWLVQPANPLTARVTVNRFWQMYFGSGIVKTVEDFGSQGEWPSHPDLLDWLATEFVRGGWDVKALQKAIVMSATYRQSSKATPELLARDPDNRLLARGPRLRLPAEMIRDQALFASGLLVEKIGGPSVRPYQPRGLWADIGSGNYEQDGGEGLYRRSMYTFWKRTAPPPFMIGFDAATRESCTVRETRTNTPLQGLNLMNDVTFVEAARMLGQRVMREGGAAETDRVSYAFRLVLARKPTEAETRTLADSLHYYLDRYRKDTRAAAEFVSQGASQRDPSIDVADLAAWTAVASLILNLDEAVTKQ